MVGDKRLAVGSAEEGAGGGAWGAVLGWNEGTGGRRMSERPRGSERDRERSRVPCRLICACGVVWVDECVVWEVVCGVVWWCIGWGERCWECESARMTRGRGIRPD